mmetsp:Transcript_24620/g.63567  ORF Transcript_24620/g.63567 Transcript_24620/m.63567 type:complete len:402 (+) Transcript_24620:358-1563(+)
MVGAVSTSASSSGCQWLKPMRRPRAALCIRARSSSESPAVSVVGTCAKRSHIASAAAAGCVPVPSAPLAPSRCACATSAARRRLSTSYAAPTARSGAARATLLSGSKTVGWAASIAADMPRTAAGTTWFARRLAATGCTSASTTSMRTPRTRCPARGPPAQSCSKATPSRSLTSSMPCTPTVASTSTLAGPPPSGASASTRAASRRAQPCASHSQRARAPSARADGISPASSARTSLASRGDATNQKRLSLFADLASRPPGGADAVRTPSRWAMEAGRTHSFSAAAPSSSRRRATHTSRCSSPQPPITCSRVSASKPTCTRGSDLARCGRASASLRAHTPPEGMDTARRSTTATSKRSGASGGMCGTSATVPARSNAPSSPTSAHTSPARAHASVRAPLAP